MEFLAEKLPELSGFLIIALFVLLGFRYVLKAGFKTFSKKMDKESALYKNWVRLMALNKTYHPVLGYLSLVAILFHIYLQTGFQLFIDKETITGAMTATALVANVVSGIIGEKVLKKPRPAWWLWAHRSLTLLMGILILIHIN